MSESEHLSKTLLDLFIDVDNGWFTSIATAVQGLTAEQAATAPAKGFNSVWAVLNHVWIIQKKILHKLQGKQLEPDANSMAYDWPSFDNPMDESAWQAACERAAAVNQELAQFIANMPPQVLAQPVAASQADAWQLIQGLIGHNSYHACEIISIRHLLGLWLENV